MFTRTLPLAALLLVTVFVAGCEDDFAEPCSMPDTALVEALCDSGTTGDSSTRATCVFRNNAQCSSRVCARYLGSEDFCSASCDVEPDDPQSNCPSGAQCRAAADGQGFCVPSDIIESSDELISE
ncbi:MAG: hypothetical protein ACI81R_000767 [Bradymonadia bacterium]